MHECEYCGEVRCVKRACLDALEANAAYYDAEIRLRAAYNETNTNIDMLTRQEQYAREEVSRRKGLLRETIQPR